MIESISLPDDVRATLPPIAQVYIAALEAEVVALQAQLAVLQSQSAAVQDQVAVLVAQVAALRARIETLQAQFNEAQARARQHSRNSSRPPSSDPPSAPPRPHRTPSGRKRGGQPGHQRHQRVLLVPDEVDETIDCRPTRCTECYAELPADLPDINEPARQQVFDLPVVKPIVTEYRYHTVSCPQCATAVHAPRPAGVPAGAFGPVVIALVGLLHGRYRLSAREIVALLAGAFSLPISLGSVAQMCREVSIALAASYAQAQAALSRSAATNVDETGWKQAGQRRWLWVAVAAVCTVFVVASNRGAATLNVLLGTAYQGIVSSDRFRAYLVIPVERRQVCWAHLKRNLTAFWERDGPIGEWGAEALLVVDKVFTIWHEFRDGKIDRPALQSELEPVQVQMRLLLERGCDLPLAKAQSFCRDLLALWPALWTFASREGVEPTNNVAERALRPAVLWRKGCFGTQSDTGNLFVARILTASATCQQQGRHLLTFLTEAVRADLEHRPSPTLVGTP